MSSIQGVSSAFTSRPSTRGRPTAGAEEEQQTRVRETAAQSGAKEADKAAASKEAQRNSEAQAARKSESRTEAKSRTPGSGVQMSNDMLVYLQS